MKYFILLYTLISALTTNYMAVEAYYDNEDFKNKNMHKYNYLRIHMYTTIGMIFYIFSLMFINYLKKY